MAFRAIAHYSTGSLYQFLIIIALSSIITGSLLTGRSVRKSLAETNEKKLYGTDYVISTVNKFFPDELADRIKGSAGTNGVEGIIETGGWVTNFKSGAAVLDVQVFGVRNTFFSFNDTDDKLQTGAGETVINARLAEKLDLNTGDNIIIRIPNPSDIPVEAPFKPEEDAYVSLIMEVAEILDNRGPEYFSLDINQAQPFNVFVPLSVFKDYFNGSEKINRILLHSEPDLSPSGAEDLLNNAFTLKDAGFYSRYSESARQYELLSERVFITEAEQSLITGSLPGSGPVLTYLVNSLETGSSATPYSFVAALPEILYDDAPEGSDIIINEWLAKDLGAVSGDSLYMGYYTMGPYKTLMENRAGFIISDIISMNDEWSDPHLMPPFPGISGKESCSNWDAGFPVDLSLIRDKDEEYWNKYSGCPKAYINYETGKELWSNNFGNATAIRLPAGTDLAESLERLEGNIHPGQLGFTVSNMKNKTLEAANNSVDFSTLFLSLGSFIMLSSVILLILVVSIQFETRKNQITTLSALGFNKKTIFRILITEFMPIALAGSIAGVFTGLLINNLIIMSLNSVWQGAVQTDTLEASSDPLSMFMGLIITVLLVLVVVILQLRSHLGKKRNGIKHHEKNTISKISSPLLILSACISIVMIIISIIKGNNNTSTWFLSGILVFITLLMFQLTLIFGKYRKFRKGAPASVSYSWSYYAHHPSRALTPVIFLAAGLFTVIITGANRKSFDTDLLSRESGTGGYLIWGETFSPLIYDMNSSKGQYEYNLDSEIFDDARFIQVREQKGNDASCLNLNQVKTPPVLGIDINNFTGDGAFSFATVMKGSEETRPWNYLNMATDSGNTIYGVIDQTVLQWNMGKEAGDTIFLTAENGTVINVVLAAGLKNSVFQGNLIISLDNFNRFFPSVPGSNIFLLDGNPGKLELYMKSLSDGLSSYGTELSPSYEKLASFYIVTNTYLTVFLTLGGFGLIMGVLGLGFVLLRNLYIRKTEYALMIAEGFGLSGLRKMILGEHALILLAGIFTGTVPALISTLPSLLSDTKVPFALLGSIILAIALTGLASIYITVKRIVGRSLTESLRKE